MIGAMVKLLRENKKLTQDQLATMTGISRHAINCIERGRTKDMSASTALALAKALEVSVETILCADCSQR